MTGKVSAGDFCQTLDVTDMASGWTETQAVLNKAQVWVFEALRDTGRHGHAAGH